MLERTAIELLKDGRLDALELLVQRYYLKGVRTAYFIVEDRSLAEDIVQTKFVELPETIRHFDVNRAFSPWFLRSVVNAAINAAKQRNRTVALEVNQMVRLPPIDSWLARTDPGPEEALESKEMHEDVIRALRALSPEQRAAIVSRYYLELGEQEMVESLHISRSNVKWRLHAAKQRLRRLLHLHAPSPTKAPGRPSPRSGEE